MWSSMRNTHSLRFSREGMRGPGCMSPWLMFCGRIDSPKYREINEGHFKKRSSPMTLTRRAFLKTTSMIALGSTVPAFLNRTAAQAPLASQPGARDTILVVVQLTGGNDGL